MVDFFKRMALKHAVVLCDFDDFESMPSRITIHNLYPVVESKFTQVLYFTRIFLFYATLYLYFLIHREILCLRINKTKLSGILQIAKLQILIIKTILDDTSVLLLK